MWATAKRILERSILVVGALVACALTFLLALYDRANAATVTAALTVAFMAFYFLPFFESFEAFGLKAKLKARLTEADNLVDQVRATAVASSKLLFTQFAWMNRIADPSLESKLRLLAEAEESLVRLQVDDATIKSVKEPIFRIVAFDLYSSLHQLIEFRVVERRVQLHVERDNKFSNKEIGISEYDLLTSRINALKNPTFSFHEIMESTNAVDFRQFVERTISETGLPREDVDALKPFVEEIIQLETRNRDEGKITNDTVQSLRQLNKMHEDVALKRERYREIFGSDAKIHF